MQMIRSDEIEVPGHRRADVRIRVADHDDQHIGMQLGQRDERAGDLLPSVAPTTHADGR